MRLIFYLLVRQTRLGRRLLKLPVLLYETFSICEIPTGVYSQPSDLKRWKVTLVCVTACANSDWQTEAVNLRREKAWETLDLNLWAGEQWNSGQALLQPLTSSSYSPTPILLLKALTHPIVIITRKDYMYYYVYSGIYDDDDMAICVFY